jgi:hypothetical protein
MAAALMPVGNSAREAATEIAASALSRVAPRRARTSTGHVSHEIVGTADPRLSLDLRELDLCNERSRYQVEVCSPDHLHTPPPHGTTGNTDKTG